MSKLKSIIQYVFAVITGFNAAQAGLYITAGEVRNALAPSSITIICILLVLYFVLEET